MTVSLAPYVPSQLDVVKRMLEIGDVDRNDLVYDLGCGDGRILFAAVQEFNVQRAVGYEIRRDLYKVVLQKIQRERLDDRVHVVNDDLLTADLSKASIITLYLTTSGNSKLKPKIMKEAKSGTKIVSHDFPIEGWSYTQREYFRGHTIYLYTMPDALKTPKKPPSKWSLSALRRLFH